MMVKLLIAWGLMALCVVIHAIGVSLALRWQLHRFVTAGRFWPMTWTFIKVAGWMILFHLIEISAWAFLYLRDQMMPDLEAALYFSAATYTTTGYGDLVLPKAWRLVGGVESLTGIMMLGWSTGFFFAIVSKILSSRYDTESK